MPENEEVELSAWFKKLKIFAGIISGGAWVALSIIFIPFIKDALITNKLNNRLFDWYFLIIMIILIPSTILSGGLIILGLMNKITK